MTVSEQIITIGVCALATIITRFLPFLIFSPNKPTPKFIIYLGKALPCAVFGMLVVYCLKNVKILSAPHGIPELIAIIFTCIIHKLFDKWLLSIAGGTICYMLLVNFIFVK